MSKRRPEVPPPDMPGRMYDTSFQGRLLNLLETQTGTPPAAWVSYLCSQVPAVFFFLVAVHELA